MSAAQIALLHWLSAPMPLSWRCFATAVAHRQTRTKRYCMQRCHLSRQLRRKIDAKAVLAGAGVPIA